MPAPPFNIDETKPGDSDLVSQFPTNERAFRDTVEDWLLIDHDTNGRHAQVTLPFVSTPAGVANTTKVWANTVGAPQYRVGTAAATYFIPPGAFMDYAGTTAPEGWLFSFGQAVSRTTYAALFTAIGTTFGAGDGSTTFNLPDLRGRVVAGKDDMGGVSANRLTAQIGGLDGDILGAAGGAETHQLTEAQIAQHTHAFNGGPLPGHTHFSGTLRLNSLAITNGAGVAKGPSTGNRSTGTPDANTVIAIGSADLAVNSGTIAGATGSPESFPPITATIGLTGSSSAHNNVQPTIILNKIIKF